MKPIIQIGIANDAWRARALCREYPTQLFFTDQDKAQQVCAACPVSHECRAEAQRIKRLDRSLSGVWGGEVFQEAS